MLAEDNEISIIELFVYKAGIEVTHNSGFLSLVQAQSDSSKRKKTSGLTGLEPRMAYKSLTDIQSSLKVVTVNL